MLSFNHLGKRDTDSLVSGENMLPELIGNRKKYLQQKDDNDTIAVPRKEASVSRPAGGESYIKKLKLFCFPLE